MARGHHLDLMRSLIALMIVIGLATSAHAADPAPAVPTPAAPSPATDPQPAAPVIRTLHWQSGSVTVGSNVATLTLPETVSYLQQDDARYVVETLFHNPPDPSTLGLISATAPGDKPAESDEDKLNQIIAIVSYETSDGHIKDDDAKTTDFTKLLKNMQDSAKEEAPERRKQGYPGVELLGWAEPPHYDPSAHILYWAENVRFDNVPEPQLNYNIRLLGARGVLVINYIAPTAMLSEVASTAHDLLPHMSFNKGNGYTEFRPGFDKVAAYGIAGLIAGGVLFKTGLLAIIGKFLIAFIKPIMVGVFAVAATVGKLFKRKKPDPRDVINPPV